MTAGCRSHPRSLQNQSDVREQVVAWDVAEAGDEELVTSPLLRLGHFKRNLLSQWRPSPFFHFPQHIVKSCYLVVQESNFLLTAKHLSSEGTVDHLL
jgi:hypothetical protein